MNRHDQHVAVEHLDGAALIEHLRALIARNARIVARTHALVARTAAVLPAFGQVPGEPSSPAS